jgi:hypothetical protein
LQRATHGRIWAGKESQRHSVASRDPDQFSSRFRGAEFFSAVHLFVKQSYQLSLLINEELRISDDVDEQDVCDLEVRIGRCRHTARSFATRYDNYLNSTGASSAKLH